EFRLRGARRPGYRSREHLLEALARPHVVAVAHGVEIDPALALAARPGERERRPPVLGILHSVGLEDEQNMDVLGEVLEPVPFLLDLEAFVRAEEAGELRIGH